MNEEKFEKCIAMMVQGDRQGLRQIYEAYIGYIYTIVYGIVKSRENAEDITSEFFIKLWEKADYYKPGGGHKGYLASMARNMTIDYIRKYKREELTAVMHGLESEEECHTSEGKVISGMEKEAAAGVEETIIGEISLKEALLILNPAERRIVDMKVLGELTFKEIAELLNIPMGTVTWKYRNAMKKLRRCGYE